MKRIATLLAVASAVTFLPSQAQGSLFRATGTILIGNPVTRETGGVSETATACGESVDQDVPADAAEGVDGRWVYLGDDPSGLWGKRATLTADRTIPANPAPVGTGNDVDAWFYDSGCSLIKPTTFPGAYHMATVGSSEEGVVPPSAQWVAIDLYRGVRATFEFTVHPD